MKKSILLGSAAALVAVTGAQAADLPVVEPVDYVRVCDAFGAGFHYIPGTETCLRFSGRVRAEIGTVGGDNFDNDADARTYLNSNFELVVNASSMTEVGMLVGQFAISGSNEGEVELGDAWITIGENILVGRETSRYDFGGGYGIFDGLYVDEGINQFTFIMPFGNGVSASLGLENSVDRQAKIFGLIEGTRTTSTLTGGVGGGNTAAVAALDGTYGGMEIPEIVASLRVSQGWGSAQISGALHQIRYNGTNSDEVTGIVVDGETLAFTPAAVQSGTVDEDYGFAVQAGVELNVGSMTKVKFVGAYADGAMHYIGGGDFYEFGFNQTTGESETYDGFYVLAALSHDFSESLNFALTASYHDFEDQAELWQIGSTVQYEVVENLLVSVAAKYDSVDYDNTALAALSGTGESDSWEARLRVQRNF